MKELSKLISCFGSQRAIATALGLRKQAVSNWRRFGIPDAQKWRLLVLARERGLPLSPEDLGLPPPGSPRVDHDEERSAA